MIREITFEETLTWADVQYIDVRSPGEFANDHLPGAVNIPLFTDEERKIIGTAYVQESKKKAQYLGLEFVAPKLSTMVAEVEAYTEIGRKVVIYCWRGGMRSHSVSTIMDLMHVPVYYLKGGYKAFRRHVNEYFAREMPHKEFLILRGMTGTGKTEIIWRLQEEKFPALDLEGLANHRGSVFGSQPGEEQPSQKQFENNLWQGLSGIKGKYVIVEGESSKIGKLFLPPNFFARMKKGLEIMIQDDDKGRIKRLVAEYGQEPIKKLAEAIGKLEKYLGKKKVAELQDDLLQKKYEWIAEILIHDYYDYTYKTGRKKKKPEYLYCYDQSSMPWQLLADFIKDYIERNGALNNGE